MGHPAKTYLTYLNYYHNVGSRPPVLVRQIGVLMRFRSYLTITALDVPKVISQPPSD